MESEAPGLRIGWDQERSGVETWDGGVGVGGGDLNWAGRSQGSKGGERPGTDSRRIGL